MGNTQYSSFCESDARQPPTADSSLPRYDFLDSCLRRAMERLPEVYLLTTYAVTRENRRAISAIEGVRDVIPMGDYVDIIVSGTEENARRVGNVVNQLTQQPVGGMVHRHGVTFSQARLERI